MRLSIYIFRLLGWTRRPAFWLLLNSLVVALVALNLLWPTSAPLHANGIPLNRSVEYFLASIFLGWLGLLLSFTVLRRLDPGAVPPQPFRWVDRGLTVTALLLGALLVLVRVSAPPEESFTACYSTPEFPSVPCLFSADGWAPIAARRIAQVSRLEEQLLFDAKQGYGWRLGAFNDLAFNVYGSDPGSRDARREGFRARRAHPFTATYAWDAATGNRLAKLYPSGVRIQIAYRGKAALISEQETRQLPFSREMHVERFRVKSTELQSLRLRYANYSCPDAACESELTMEPLSFSDAVFRVSLALGDTPVDQAKPLDQRLLAQADPPLSPRRWGPHIEVVFVLMALGRLATWMIRVSLARRPSLGLVTAAILLACVLIGVFPTGALDRFVVVLQARPEFMLVGIVALSAFLGALSVVAALLRMRGSGHVLRATVAGRLLLVSCALLAPLVTVGVMLACLTLGSFFTGSIFGSLPDAPILGSLPDAPPSLAELKSLSFAMMALPIVLGAAGVLAVVIMQRSWAVGSIAPALLVVISVGLVQMPALVATAVPIAPIPVQEIYDPARVHPTLWQLPPRDDTELFNAGNDHLTYSALPKAFLHNPQPENYLLLNTPEQLLTKPLFMYFRAARYALLGDGEFYSLALARALITWVIAVCGVLCLAAIGATQGVPRARDSRSRIGMGLLAGSAALTWVWLAYAMATPSDFFLLLSEGGALASVLLSFGVLVVASGRSLLLCGVAGAIFAISVLYRSTHLPLAFLGLAIVGLGFGGSASRWVRASIAYIAPIATAVLVIWLHAGAPISMPRSMGSYTAYNLGPPQAPPGSFIQGLVPNVLTLQITCAVLLAIVIALVMGATTSMRVRVACLGLAVIIGALLPLLPQRGAPYYPRSLVTAYYALAFVPAALLIDRWQRPPSDGGNGNAGPG